MDSGLLDIDSGSLDNSYSAEQVAYLEEKKQNVFGSKRYSRIKSLDVQSSSGPFTNPFMQPQQFNNFQQQNPNQQSHLQPGSQQPFFYSQQNQSFDLFAPTKQTNNYQNLSSFEFKDYSQCSASPQQPIQVNQKENVDSNKVQGRYFKNGGNYGDSLIDLDFIANNAQVHQYDMLIRV